MPAECLVLLPWTVSPPTKIKVHIGGSVRRYQELFASLAAAQTR
jgi:hypothetical protein